MTGEVCISPSLIIGQNEDDVGWSAILFLGDCQRAD
jgi:hypothetical protein